MSLLDKPRKMLYEWNTRRHGEETLRSLDRVLQNEDTVLLVHQMGRAGSMTTVNTLRASGLSLPIFHTHWLNPASVKTRQRWVKHLPESRHPLNVRVSERIATHLQQRGMGSRNWKLVTVFREPIARNVSVFFLAMDAFLKDFQEKNWNGEINLQQRYKKGELDNQLLLKVFLEEFPHNEPLDWFNDEVKEVFGLDVLQHPFPKEQGYQIIRSENIDLLLIKLEQLDVCHQQAFQEFLGVDIPALRNTHVSELDPTKPMYADFVKSTLLPEDYLERMYTSDFAQHFYSEEEISGFRGKWSGRTL